MSGGAFGAHLVIDFAFLDLVIHFFGRTQSLESSNYLVNREQFDEESFLYAALHEEIFDMQFVFVFERNLLGLDLTGGFLFLPVLHHYNLLLFLCVLDGFQKHRVLYDYLVYHGNKLCGCRSELSLIVQTGSE